MTTQLEAFPPTIDELLAAYRSRLEADVEKATDSAIKATTRQAEAMDALRFFDAAMVAARTEPEQTPAPVTAYAVTAPYVHVGPSPEDGGYTSVSCGDRTRFSNLVYAWAEMNGVSDPDEWRILDPSGHEVDGRIVVPATSYGCTYTVERRAS